MRFINQKSLVHFGAILAMLFLILILPTLLHLQSPEQQQATQQQNNNQSRLATASSIFNNNLMVAGISLVPYFGWGYIIFVLWNTGTVIASYGQPWYWVLNNMFAWIELAVYSYMILKSIKLVQLFRQRKTKFTDLEGKVVVRKTVGVYPEIVKTLAYTFIVASMVLLASALIEYALISRVLTI
jgi:hypothetical protein